MTSPGGTAAAALDSIARSLAEICGDCDGGGDHRWDPPRRFSDFARRLEAVVRGLAGAPELLSSPAVRTALGGVAADLDASRPTLSVYRGRSPIYILIHCVPLSDALRGRVASLAAWLALLDSPLASLPDLRKKATDLSRDMDQTDLKVTETEERVYSSLQREAKEVVQSSKAVQSATVMDLARALGIDPADHGKLGEQIKLLRADLSGLSSLAERRILISLEKILDDWSKEPCIADGLVTANFEEEAQIPPFKNFLCPLTKGVMKDPVVLESSQTYERAAICHWFDRCLEDGRDPTCPVTGKVLHSLELRPNIGLAGAIEEWVNRNVEIQINSALQYLAEESSCPVECILTVLDNVYRISEEHPSCRYKVRNAGIVALVVKLLKDQSSRMGSELRGKTLMAMHSMAKDGESKLIMLEQGITRLAIRSLTGRSEMEKEYALKLLLEFSIDTDCCTRIALEKGALVLLSSMAANSDHPTSSNLAEEVLKNLEKVEDNVQHLAMAGRFQPLVARLCNGTEDVRLEIATLVGKMSLTNNGKDYIARQGGRILINMLSSNQEQQEASLHALYNLSTLDDNAAILVDFGILPTLMDILFATQQDAPSEIKELAASTVANIVSISGHWELSFGDKEGHQIQSEFIIRKLLDVLSHSPCKCQAAVLHILCGIASSPRASDMAASCIESSGGLKIVVQYIEYSEIDHRVNAFRLLNLLSEKLGQVLAEELRASNKIVSLKGKLLDAHSSLEERCEVAGLLANLPILDDEVKTVLGSDLLTWIISHIREEQSISSGRNSKKVRRMLEGLLGLLLHYAKTPDPTIITLVQENQFMRIFREQLNSRPHSRAKQRAVLGLKYLSEFARVSVATDLLEPQPPRGLCSPLVLLCGMAPMVPILCPLHNVPCDGNSSFCLLKGNAVKPLIDLMNDENVDVQLAAVEALSTILSDVQNLKNAKEELEQLGLFRAAIYLFKEVRPGKLQEKVALMVERFFQVEALAQDYSTDQDLVMALVGAMKHGNANTKKHAQDALANLRVLSGVGGKPSSNHGKRSNR
ncbi:U-box domain-containing protein 44-like [Musa acuminata AAA Group]|uniref:U-box domain-containing protein 44-like n=1 Tax=Musa acuminata AAA Group TaxID=214697 RepID=UPI0031E2A49A